MMQLSQVHSAVGGLLHGSDVHLNGVATDTRGDCRDKLFIALQGENFDGNDFVEQAAQAGATAAIVSRKLKIDLPLVVVDDTQKALAQLASWWRQQFVIPVIAVTGSVGKTSVKEMLGHIFSQLGEGVVTAGNLNNEIGLPLTLLRLRKGDRYAIVELGMSQAGEIERLTKAAKPTVALVNNAAAAHLQGLGTVEAVARAKGEIFLGLNDDGIGIINADDQYAPIWRDSLGSRQCLSFGLEQPADVTASYKTKGLHSKLKVSVGDERFKTQINAIGRHNIMNVLAAITAASAAHIPTDLIADGLRHYQPVNGRLKFHAVGDFTIIDDSYNANPASMKAAIEVLANFKNSTLIVGDMAELGEAAEQAHQQIGQLASQNNIRRLFACGQYAPLVVENFNGEKAAFNDQQQLLEALLEQPLEGTFLVKGSRSAKMEKVVQQVQQQAEMLLATKHVQESC